MASLSVRGQAAPLLEPVDASFDRVALLVFLGVESGRAAAGAATPPTMADLVGRLWNDCADAASAEMAPDRAGRVGPIGWLGPPPAGFSAFRVRFAEHGCQP